MGIVAAIVAVLGLCEASGWPFLKGPAERQLTQRLQRPVAFGDSFRLRLLGSIRLDTSALHVGAPRDLPAGSPLGGDLASAKDVHLALPWSTVFALMRGDAQAPHITSLRLGSADATLKRQADGHANWNLGKPSEPRKPMEMPEVDELVLRQGHVVFDDGVSKTFIEAHASTSEGQGSGKENGVVIDGQGRHEDRPFDFHVTSAGVLPLVSRDSSTRVPIKMRVNAEDSKFAFEGTATDLLSFKALEGDALLAGPSLARVGDSLGVTLPTTEPFQLRGHVSKSGMVWALKNAELNVGDSRLGGNFDFDRSHKVPLLSGELVGSRMVLADLLPAFGAPRAGAGNPKPPAGRVLPQREFDVPSLHRMNASVKVRLQRAELGSLFREPLSPLQGDLSLQGGVLKLTNLLARAAGGEVKGSVGLDANPAVPLWSADLRWAGVELDQFLRPRNNRSQVSKPSGENIGYVTGKIGGHAQLQARGKSTAQMIGSTDGTVQAWIRNGTVSHLVVEGAGIDLAQALGVAIIGDNPLAMQCAVVKANAKNGQVTPEVAIVDTKDSTLFVTGSVSLASEKLDLTLTTRPKDKSPLSLRTPVHVEGTFEHPKVSLEKGPLERKLLGAAALALLNPLAALIPLVDLGDKEHAGGCASTLQALRDADGPPGARDAKAPKPSEVREATPADKSDKASRPTRQAAAPGPDVPGPK